MIGAMVVISLFSVALASEASSFPEIVPHSSEATSKEIKQPSESIKISEPSATISEVRESISDFYWDEIDYIPASSDDSEGSFKWDDIDS